MRLSKLEINGFKSFCNKTEILFPKNITGIVGPNGSGKSNIADAVRWVLGEQNPRLLRGGKMEDIIFNGTQKRKAVNFCEVSLLFDNEDKILHPDYSEIMVTRRVFRNGESEYEINKTPCRLKDIIEMFSDTGIGKEGYSIIGQGKIDEILSRKTEDRRAVFEEAAGISYYKLKKHEAELRLSRTEENLLRINDIADEQERLLEPLRIQAENAKRFLSLSESLKKVSCALFLLDYDSLTAKEQTTKSNIDEVNNKVVEFEVDLERLAESLSKEQSLSEELEETCALSAEQTILAQRALSALRERLVDTKTRLENADTNLARFQQDIQELKTKEETLQSSIDAEGTAKKEAEQRLADITKNLRAMEVDFDKETEAQEILSIEIEEKKAKIIESMNALSKTESGKSRLLAIKEQMHTRIAEFQNSKTKLAEANKSFAEQLSEKQAAYDKENQTLQSLKQETAAISRDLEEQILRIREQQKISFDLTQEFNSSSARYKTMQDMAEEYEGYSPAVKNAMASAKKKQLKGVYGTVASVLRVPQKYETAIDMLLGGALQNIITEDETDAKILIEELRINKAGRATFLPICSVHSMTLNGGEKQYLRSKGCLGVASELVQYDARFQGVIENLLGRTLIVETLDDGIALRRTGSKLRIVTLMGDVMHSGGSMTGGSVKSNSSSFLSRQRLIDELRIKIESCGQKLRQTNSLIDAWKQKRESLEQARKEAEDREHMQAIQIARLSEILKSAKEDMEQYIEQEQELENTVQTLLENIADIDQELHVLINENEDAQSNTEQLNSEVERLTQRMNRQNARCAELREQLVEMRLEHSSSEHEYQQFLRDERRANDTLKEYQQKLLSTNQQMTQLASSKEQLKALEIQLSSEIAATQTQHQDLEHTQKELETKRSDTFKKIRMLQEEENNMRGAHIKILDRLHKLELSLSSIEAEKKALSDNLWNSYELTYANAEPYRPEKGFSLSKANQEQRELKEEIRALGSVNVNAVEEYKSLKERHEELIMQRADLTASIRDLNNLIKTLLSNMELQFVDSFNKLRDFFSETFVRLFGGGSAELSLTDPDNALECGIEIIVQPPGKKKQMLSLFSGGERALTAIALIFAMLKLRPSPFCIFDEIEAALDDANINYFADYLKEFSSKTQFIVVTHRKGTMERCDSLYGIAMAEKGVSSMLSIDVSSYQE